MVIFVSVPVFSDEDDGACAVLNSFSPPESRRARWLRKGSTVWGKGAVLPAARLPLARGPDEPADSSADDDGGRDADAEPHDPAQPGRLGTGALAGRPGVVLLLRPSLPLGAEHGFVAKWPTRTQRAPVPHSRQPW